MDTRYCAPLTALKRHIGMPWSFVLEFHGWWHVLTAVGAYLFMAMVESLTREEVDFSGLPSMSMFGYSNPRAIDHTLLQKSVKAL